MPVGECYTWEGNIFSPWYCISHIYNISTPSHPKTVCLNCGKWGKQMFAFIYFIRYNSTISVTNCGENQHQFRPWNVPPLLSAHCTTKDIKNIWALTIRWLELCVSVSIFVCDWCLYTGVPWGEWTQSGLTLWSEPLLNSEQVGKYSLSQCVSCTPGPALNFLVISRALSLFLLTGSVVKSGYENTIMEMTCRCKTFLLLHERSREQSHS